jgi:hypothetical protein
MRSPQSLATYLQLEGHVKSEPFVTYQAMLDRLWSERVPVGEHGARRAQLAYDIADRMAEEESLWLASARFDSQSNEIQALIRQRQALVAAAAGERRQAPRNAGAPQARAVPRSVSRRGRHRRSGQDPPLPRGSRHNRDADGPPDASHRCLSDGAPSHRRGGLQGEAGPHLVERDAEVLVAPPRRASRGSWVAMCSERPGLPPISRRAARSGTRSPWPRTKARARPTSTTASTTRSLSMRSSGSQFDLESSLTSASRVREIFLIRVALDGSAPLPDLRAARLATGTIWCCPGRSNRRCCPRNPPGIWRMWA